MFGAGSTYFVLACIVVGAVALLGMGTLFVRATNIERPNLVGGMTLALAGIAAILLWVGSRNTPAALDKLAWSAITLSIFGFLTARLLDAILGARARVHHDHATLDGDLAD